MKRTLKLHATGTTPSVEFDIPGKYVVTEINAGYGNYLWGSIKAAEIRRTTGKGAPFDTYFASGISVPCPGGNHSSLWSWHGAKFIDGDEYTLKIVGSIHTSDTLYVEVVIDDSFSAVFAAGVGCGLANLAYTYPAGERSYEAVNCTVAAPDANKQPSAGVKWLLINAAVSAGALDAQRTFMLGFYDGTVFRLIDSLTVSSNVRAVFDLSSLHNPIVTRDEYLRVDTDMAGTDATHAVYFDVLVLNE